MTERDPDQPGTTPFPDADERAEAAWLRAREASPTAPPPSPEVGRAYQQLDDLLATLPALPEDAGWQDEVLARARAARPTSWWRRSAVTWSAGGVALAAAAAALLLLRPRPAPAELEVATRRGDVVRAAPDEVAVGDHLVVHARPRGAAELRVYRAADTLVARCPDGPACRTVSGAPGEQLVDLRLDAPVTYHVILVVGTTGAAPDASMDEYLAAARAAHARIVTYPPIEVH